MWNIRTLSPMVQKIKTILKFFKTRSKFKVKSRSTKKKGLFMRYLYVKYQNPILFGSEEIA
jgi:hypothetical protein